LRVSVASFAAITLCVASQQVTPEVSLYFFVDSVQKILDTPSYRELVRLRLDRNTTLEVENHILLNDHVLLATFEDELQKLVHILYNTPQRYYTKTFQDNQSNGIQRKE